MWEYIWKKRQEAGQDIPSTVKTTLEATDEHLYPNIFSVLKTLAVLPVTTSECERSVSTLRRLTTYMRSAMTGRRINALALMNVHRMVDLNVNTLVDNFADRNPRKMQLRDILKDN